MIADLDGGTDRRCCYVYEGDHNVQFFNLTLLSFGSYDTNGGTIFAGKIESLKLFNVTIRDSFEQLGGAVCSYLLRQDVLIQGSTFQNNYAKSGTVFSQQDSSLAIFDSKFIGNNATNNGGAIYVKLTVSFEIDDVNLVNNSAAGNGGAVYLSETDITVHRSYFMENKGGAVYAQKNVAFHNCTFYANSVPYYGYVIESGTFDCMAGGIYLAGGDALFSYCRFVKNEGFFGKIYFLPVYLSRKITLSIST